MSEITTDIVKRIAHLACLDIKDSEIIEYRQNLNKTLNLIDQMQSINTNTIKPMGHPLDIDQPLRKDIITEKNQQDLMQSIAPQVLNGLYLVPKVIE